MGTRKVCTLLLGMLISVTALYGVVTKSTQADKKIFGDLTDVSFTKTALASKERKQNRIEDLNNLAVLMVDKLIAKISASKLGETLKISTDNYLAQTLIKPAMPRAQANKNVSRANTYALEEFETTFEKALETQAAQLNPEECKKILNATLETFNKNYTKVMSALKQLVKNIKLPVKMAVDELQKPMPLARPGTQPQPPVTPPSLPARPSTPTKPQVTPRPLPEIPTKPQVTPPPLPEKPATPGQTPSSGLLSEIEKGVPLKHVDPTVKETKKGDKLTEALSKSLDKMRKSIEEEKPKKEEIPAEWRD